MSVKTTTTLQAVVAIYRGTSLSLVRHHGGTAAWQLHRKRQAQCTWQEYVDQSACFTKSKMFLRQSIHRDWATWTDACEWAGPGWAFRYFSFSIEGDSNPMYAHPGRGFGAARHGPLSASARVAHAPARHAPGPAGASRCSEIIESPFSFCFRYFDLFIFLRFLVFQKINKEYRNRLRIQNNSRIQELLVNS